MGWLCWGIPSQAARNFDAFFIFHTHNQRELLVLSTIDDQCLVQFGKGAVQATSDCFWKGFLRLEEFASWLVRASRKRSRFLRALCDLRDRVRQ